MRTFAPIIEHPTAVLRPAGLTVIRCDNCPRTWHATPASELRAVASYLEHECENQS